MTVNPAAQHSTTATLLTPRRRSIVARVALYLGALAVLGTGVVHIQQYYAQDY
jgi:hypothetical protein